MDYFPPEKYYEACVTYHIVRYYEENFDERIFPFSISQIQERREGYDFGYLRNPEQVFYIQYKRPDVSGLSYDGYVWRVDIEQLETIIRRHIGHCTYYAFPGFCHISEWYQGLEKTWFLSADDLFTQLRLRKKLTQKSVVVRAKNWRLKSFEAYFSRNPSYDNVMVCESCPDGSLQDMPELMDGAFWGYAVQKR